MVVPDVTGASLRKAIAEQVDMAGSHLQTERMIDQSAGRRLTYKPLTELTLDGAVQGRHQGLQWSTRGSDPTPAASKATVVDQDVPRWGGRGGVIKSHPGPTEVRRVGIRGWPQTCDSSSGSSSKMGGLSSTGTEKSKTAWNALRKSSRRWLVHERPPGGI